MSDLPDYGCQIIKRRSNQETMADPRAPWLAGQPGPVGPWAPATRQTTETSIHNLSPAPLGLGRDDPASVRIVRANFDGTFLLLFLF